MNIDTQEFIEALCQELGIENSGVDLQTRLKDIPEWDSLGMVRFLLTCDERYGVQLPAVEAGRAVTVEELKQKVEEAGE